MSKIMQIIKFITFILTLWYSISIFSRLFILAVGIKYNRSDVARPITKGEFMLWAIFSGTFIYLQWFIK